MTSIRLSSGHNSAEFDMYDGARLTEMHLGGYSLMVGPEDRESMWWGAFVMAPWTSLLREGAIDVDVERFRVSDPGTDAAWHGVARESAWSLGKVGVDRLNAECILCHPWPLEGTASMAAVLTEDALTLRLGVRAGSRRMPAAVGWHPWFVRELDGAPGELQVPGDALVQQRDEDGIPTGSWEPRTDGVSTWNDCVQTAGPFFVVYPGVGALRVSSSAPWATLFSADAGGICIEPVTSAAERMDDVLDPGEGLALEIELRWVVDRVSEAAPAGGVSV